MHTTADFRSDRMAHASVDDFAHTNETIGFNLLWAILAVRVVSESLSGAFVRQWHGKKYPFFHVTDPISNEDILIIIDSVGYHPSQTLLWAQALVTGLGGLLTIAGLAHVIAQTYDVAIAVSNNFWEALVRPVRILEAVIVSPVVGTSTSAGSRGLPSTAIDASGANQRAAEAWREGSHAELDAPRGAARTHVRPARAVGADCALNQ
ncbi:hypothetical protein EDB89DRAFT_2072759 [Lactarius sanguifluus]|nr:hypothetical protein EDB89DRAFT_2072759 [Lactarius sanguifluus]